MEAAATEAHASATSDTTSTTQVNQQPAKKGRRSKKSAEEDEASKKRRCISSACVPCRKRKSKVRDRVAPSATRFSAGRRINTYKHSSLYETDM